MTTPKNKWNQYVKKVLSQDRTTEQVDLRAVGSYFKKLGFEVLELRQPWRHVAGKLRKNGTDYFVKMGSTIDLSRLRTQREKLWLEYVGSNMTGNEPFIIPKVYGSGLFEGTLFWFTSDWFEPKQLAIKKPADPRDLNRWIPLIASAAFKLLAIPTPQPGEGFYDEMYPEDKNEPSPIDRLLANASFWAEESGENLQDILAEIEEAINEFEKGQLKLVTAVSHGDFVPWHMFEVNKKKFALIDADLGSFRTPRYYDVANFYRSVWVNLGPEFSRHFLQKFLTLYQPTNTDQFWVQFRPILAQRIIGGFWDNREKPHQYQKANQTILQAFRQNTLI